MQRNLVKVGQQAGRLVGSVLNLHFIDLDPQSKVIAIDEQANDNIVLRVSRLIRVRNVMCLHSIFLDVTLIWLMLTLIN
jgi:hypothetical protein